MIAKSCSIQKVRNLMGIIKEISYFFNLSPKREQFLKDVKKLFDVDTTKENLIDVCLTRWVARIDGLVVFETLFTIIVYALEKMKDNTNPDIHFNDDTSTKASNLYKSCYNFDFAVALVITRSILSYTSAVTELLPKKSNDILQAYQLIESVKAQFHDIRANVNIFHEELHKVALELAEKVQLQESMPRSCNRQVHRDNQPYSNWSEYYKYIIIIPLVDHVVAHLQSYFSSSNITVTNGFYLVPHVLYKANNNNNVNWRENVWSFLKFYNKDFVLVKDIPVELDLWERYWTKEFKGNLPTTVSDTLDTLNELNPYSYPTVFKALKIIAVLPSTSCSCERSISSLRRLKDYAQSTMKSDRLNGLASMYIHRDIYINPSFVLKKFVLANPNRRDNFGIVN